MIIQSGVGEGILGAIVVFGFFAILFGGFQWIMAKFFGTKIHGKFQANQAYQEINQDEIALNKLIATDPLLVEKAIEKCKTKGYSKTHSNILSEYHKLKNIQRNEQLKYEQSKKSTPYQDLELMKRERDKKNALTIFNSLFFEFENEIFIKAGISLQDFHLRTKEKDPELKSVKSYENLFNLYKSEILSELEFTDKKRKMIIDLLT